MKEDVEDVAGLEYVLLRERRGGHVTPEQQGRGRYARAEIRIIVP